MCECRSVRWSTTIEIRRPPPSACGNNPEPSCLCCCCFRQQLEPSAVRAAVALLLLYRHPYNVLCRFPNTVYRTNGCRISPFSGHRHSHSGAPRRRASLQSVSGCSEGNGLGRKRRWTRPTDPKLAKRVRRLANSSAWRMGRTKSCADGVRVPPDGSRCPPSTPVCCLSGGDTGGKLARYNSLYKYQWPQIGQTAWEKWQNPAFGAWAGPSGLQTAPRGRQTAPGGPCQQLDGRGCSLSKER